jgi:Fe-S-cluster containining protein
MEIDIPTRYGPLQARFNVPAGTMRLSEFVFSLFPLEERLMAMAVRAAQQEDRAVSCRAGCGACCRQPIPLSLPEAFLLFEVWARQPTERRGAILSRVESAKAELASLGDRSLLSAEHNAKEVVSFAFDYFRLDLACPFLEAESCSIHAHRPMSCREHLVTSPAEHCSVPLERRGENIVDNPAIRPVLAPASLTFALAALYAELEGGEPVYVPLVLALDRVVELREARERKHLAVELFASFFRILEPLLRARI